MNWTMIPREESRANEVRFLIQGLEVVFALQPSGSIRYWEAKCFRSDRNHRQESGFELAPKWRALLEKKAREEFLRRAAKVLCAA